VVERSERYASEARPEGHKDSKARARVGVLAAVNAQTLDSTGSCRIVRKLRISQSKLFSLFKSMFDFICRNGTSRL
jgi:hypothetical protein